MSRPTPPGHELLHGGSAVDAELLPTGQRDGVAACACGHVSEDLPSNGARRGWHRAHLVEAVGRDGDDGLLARAEPALGVCGRCGVAAPVDEAGQVRAHRTPRLRRCPDPREE